MDNSVRVHYGNIQCFAIEMCEVKLGIAPKFMADIFTKRSISDDTMLGKLRNPFYNFENPRTVRYGNETLRSLGAKIWNILPNDIKSSPNLITFKNKI